MAIAITGATGQLGMLVIERLLETGASEGIIALARDPAKVEATGIEARRFDYDQPETHAAALTGVETLLLISSSEIGKRAAQHRNVIKAAKAAGVRRIAYTSLLHAPESILGLAGEHRETEAMLAESGLAITLLRNGWYSENYTASIPPALAHGAFIGSAGSGLISSASRRDYAEAAVAVLHQPGHEGKTYELAGDAAYTLSELAAELSRQTGRDIPYVDLSEAEYAAALIKAGLPEGLAAAFASFDTAAAQGALHDDSGQLSRLIGRPTTPIAQSVAETVAGESA